MQIRKKLSACRSWISLKFKSQKFKSPHDYSRKQAENVTMPSPAKPLHILVTGSSSGFGELIVKTLGKAGHHVFASMRSIGDRNLEAAARLRRWAEKEKAALEVVELDVTDQVSVERAVSLIENIAGHIDVVINNAGAGGMGIVEAFSIDQMQAMFEVNTFGAMRVNKAVLPAMRRRKSGLILQVSSTAGRIVIPEGNPYIATKFAMEALAESLHHQLVAFGVDVVILEPGYYPTTSFDQKKTPPADDRVLTEYAAVIPALRTAQASVTPNPGAPDPQEVADVVKRIVETPKGERPLRVVVGTVASAGVAELNAAYDRCKKKMLISLGASV